MPRRGPRGTARMLPGRPRARHLCLSFPTRTGDARTPGGLARVDGADAAPRFAAPRRAQEAGAAASNLPLALRARGAPASPGPGPLPGPLPPRGGKPDTPLAPAPRRSPALPRLPRQPAGEAGATAPCAGPLPRPRGPLLGRERVDEHPARPPFIVATASGKARQTATHTHCLLLGLLSPACTVSERSCPGAAVLGNSFNFLALRFNPPELAASSSARSSPRFKGTLKPPLLPPPPPPGPPLAPAPPWCCCWWCCCWWW